MNFKPEKFFIDAINSGSIKEIKRAMCLYIDKDAADVNDEIKQAINYLESKGINIWDEHKKIEAIRPKSQWDEYYIGLLQSDLMYNFSKERMELILDVGKHVYANEKYFKRAMMERQNTSNNESEKKKVSTINRNSVNGSNMNNYSTDMTKSSNLEADKINNIYKGRSSEKCSNHNRQRQERDSQGVRPIPSGKTEGGIDVKGFVKTFYKRIITKKR